VQALGRQIDPEELDGDEPIVVGIERTEHGTRRSRTNLMKNPKRTEGVGRGAGKIRGQ
jgi:hypothetical protein